MSKLKPKMFDVLSVAMHGHEDRKPGIVRVMAKNETESEAEAFVKFAIMRRGVSTEFFAVVKAGKYKDGDKFKGSGK